MKTIEIIKKDETNHNVQKSKLEISLDSIRLITEEQVPTAGTGRCYSCDCKGYRKSDDPGWCKCGHHYDRHQ